MLQQLLADNIEDIELLGLGQAAAGTRISREDVLSIALHLGHQVSPTDVDELFGAWGYSNASSLLVDEMRAQLKRSSDEAAMADEPPEANIARNLAEAEVAGEPAKAEVGEPAEAEEAIDPQAYEPVHTCADTVMDPARSWESAEDADASTTAHEAEDLSVSLIQQLRSTLASNAARAIHLFRELDDGGDGKLSVDDFQQALPLLGFDCTHASINGLFKSFGPDKAGMIPLDDLPQLLRTAAEEAAAAAAAEANAAEQPTWHGSLLPRRALVLLMGPTTNDKIALARRLSYAFDGTVLSLETLEKREVASSTELGLKIQQIAAAGGTIPANLRLVLIRQAVSRLRGPFILQDYPRTFRQMQELEQVLQPAAVAVELHVTGHAFPEAMIPVRDLYDERRLLVRIKSRWDALKMVRHVEEWLTEKNVRVAAERKEQTRAAEAAAAAGRAEQRKELEAAVAIMKQARREHAVVQAQALTKRQQNQRAGYKNRVLQVQTRRIRQMEADAEVYLHLHQQRRGMSPVRFVPLPGGFSINPGNAQFEELQQRWHHLQFRVGKTGEVGGRSMQSAARKYATTAPILHWDRQELVAGSRSLPSLHSTTSSRGF